MLSTTEENYLKALFRLTWESGNKSETGTNELAAHLNIKPATASDMLKKLKEKKLIDYEKYGKSSLTKKGKKLATDIVRKHRLWETFLFEKLEFTWDEVHEVAEQLEHIRSVKLIDRLNKFLNYPTIDPHGDIIPQADDDMKMEIRKTLNEVEVGSSCIMVGVNNNSAEFLQYVDKLGLTLNKPIKVLSRQSYDEMLEVEIKGKKSSVSPRVAENIIIRID